LGWSKTTERRPKKGSVGGALEAYEEWWLEDQGRSIVQVFGTGFWCRMSARDFFCGLLFYARDV
jgi:hypothetical protein